MPFNPSIIPQTLTHMIDWVYPPQCMVCHTLQPPGGYGQTRRYLCVDCRPFLVPIKDPICPNCGVPSGENTDGGGGRLCQSCRKTAFAFSHNRAVFVYDGVIRDLIHAMKFQSRRYIAEGLAHVMADIVCGEWADINGTITDTTRIPFFFPGDTLIDCFIPIPLHPRKKNRRGFNQAEVLASVVAKKLYIPMIANGLTRMRNTKPQSGVSFQARVANVEDAFLVGAGFNAGGRHVCLVDDIFTTGATLSACSAMLLAAGVASVSCLCLSIVVPKNN